jgi:hypothetical protein
MPDRNHTSVLERYQDHRTARFLKQEKAWAHSLPRWRSRSRRRALVVALALTLLFMTVVSVLCATGLRTAALLWLPACVLFTPIWIVIQIVSGRRGDAPEGALDEFEIARRNNARSIALTLTSTLMMVPIFYLIIGATQRWGDGHDLAYSGGLMTLTVLLMGVCAPAMMLAWTAPDPDPDES